MSMLLTVAWIGALGGVTAGTEMASGTRISCSLTRPPWLKRPFSPRFSPWSEASTTIVRSATPAALIAAISLPNSRSR